MSATTKRKDSYHEALEAQVERMRGHTNGVPPDRIRGRLEEALDAMEGGADQSRVDSLLDEALLWSKLASGELLNAYEVTDLLRYGRERVEFAGAPESDGADGTHLSLDEEEVQTVLAVAFAVALASDGELGDNTRFDRTPKSLRPVWSALTDRMEPLVARLREAAGMSMEEELRVGSDGVSSIKGSLRSGEES